MTLERFMELPKRTGGEKELRLKSILSKLGIECARVIEEKVDLQFDALENLYENLSSRELFIKLVMANALISYQLSGRGEDWWWEFSRYFSSNPPGASLTEAYSRFLPRSRTNRRLVAQKVSRLGRFEPFLDSLSLHELKGYYFGGMGRLRDEISQMLNSKRNAKTIVFAVKMFGYAGRIAFGEFVPYPMEIEIPEDSRISSYTKRFTNETPARFWSRIGRETGIPPLHIDSILWPLLGGNKKVMKRLRLQCPEYGLALELLSF